MGDEQSCNYLAGHAALCVVAGPGSSPVSRPGRVRYRRLPHGRRHRHTCRRRPTLGRQDRHRRRLHFDRRGGLPEEFGQAQYRRHAGHGFRGRRGRRGQCHSHPGGRAYPGGRQIRHHRRSAPTLPGAAGKRQRLPGHLLRPAGLGDNDNRQRRLGAS